MKKKKIIMTLCVVLFTILFGYGCYVNYYHSANMSDPLILLNAEALAQDAENEKLYFHKEKITIACGESYHEVQISETESYICYDVKTMTIDVCYDEGGVLKCNDQSTMNIQHNPGDVKVE